MQALCAFAHASEVSVRENQRIRWRIVHGEIKGIVFFLKYANFLDYIPKIRSIIWISTINKAFCGLLMAFKSLSS